MQSRRRRLIWAAPIALAVLALATATANACQSGTLNPADAPPFGGGKAPRVYAPVSGPAPVNGYELPPRKVAAIAREAIGSDIASSAATRVQPRGDAGVRPWRGAFSHRAGGE